MDIIKKMNYIKVAMIIVILIAVLVLKMYIDKNTRKSGEINTTTSQCTETTTVHKEPKIIIEPLTRR